MRTGANCNDATLLVGRLKTAAHFCLRLRVRHMRRRPSLLLSLVLLLHIACAQKLSGTVSLDFGRSLRKSVTLPQAFQRDPPPRTCLHFRLGAGATQNTSSSSTLTQPGPPSRLIDYFWLWLTITSGRVRKYCARMVRLYRSAARSHIHSHAPCRR